MAGEGDIAALAGQLGKAVELTMSPTVPMEERHRAFTQLEEFKESSPYGSQCGLYLVTHSTAPVARHFGLKLLEDIVKARWNSMVAEEKLFIKESLMTLMGSGTGHITTEHLFMKDALARVVVELVKREWPQQWPGLLQELDQLCRAGETQTELVMFVLLRLVEDVAVLQTLQQSQRRKEIYSALTANMEHLFTFLMGLLEKHYRAYREGGSAEHCRVATAILNTFGALVEWASIQHSMANDKYLIRCLTHLLTDPRLQQTAGDCLLSLVSWRAGKAAERAHLLCLFEDDMMPALFAATGAAEARSGEGDGYSFLKRMVEILTVLGDQLCYLWTKETPRAGLANLGTYLDALLALTRHPSQAVAHMSNELWGKFLRHPDIGAHPQLLAHRGRWLEAAVRGAVRQGRPEATDHPSCAYSQLDHDTDEEWHAAFTKYRLCILENVRHIALAAPLLPLGHLDAWLRAVLAEPTPALPELEAISALLDATFSKLTEPEQVQEVAHLAVPLLQLLLQPPPSSPLIMSELLSSISALFPCVLLQPSALQPILARLFTPLHSPNTSNSKEVRTLRRHCCALLVKLGSRFPATLAPSFAFLRSEVAGLEAAGLVSKMELVTLTEGLVIVSNHLHDFSRQSGFLAEVLGPAAACLAQLELQIGSPEALVPWVGLAQDPSTPLEEHLAHRQQLTTAVNTVLAVVRRAAGPTDLAVAARGGFLAREGGEVRNPASATACAALPRLLLLVQTLNRVVSPAGAALLHPAYAKVTDMLVVDRNNILGLPGSRTARNEVTHSLERLPEPVMRMQNFLTELFENLQHLLAHYSANLGPEFYQRPGLGQDLVRSSLSHLPSLPLFRLRAIVKMFLKAFITHCPEGRQGEVLEPVLAHLLPFMLQHLSDKWADLKRIRESPGFDEDNTDSQEVLDDVVLRMAAREYLDLVRAVLVSGGGAMEGEEEVKGVVLGRLGEAVLAAPALSQPLTLTILAALSWSDSTASIKACGLVDLVLPRLVEVGGLQGGDAARTIVALLQALQEMGHIESNNIALTHTALACYERLRPNFPCVRDVLARIPNVQAEDLAKFDERILAAAKNASNKVGEKAKKDMFRKLVGPLVGRETARLFQKEIVIKNLPNMAVKVKAKTPSLDEQTERTGADTGLATLFAQ